MGREAGVGGNSLNRHGAGAAADPVTGSGIMSDRLLTEDLGEIPGVGKAEIALATDVVLSMVKAAKGLRMYQENNPVLEKFFQELVEKFNLILDEYSEYALDVDKFELRYKGHVIYENSDPKESIAFKIYSDGIRCIIFSQGLESCEISGFLQIIGSGASASIDEDIATRFWDSAFPHFAYVLEDDYQEIDLEIEEQFAASAGKADLPASFPEAVAASAIPLVQVQEHLLAFTDEDRISIAALIDAEEHANPVEESARIFADILAGAFGQDIFSPFLDIYLKFAANIFVSGNAGTGLKMFSVLYRRATSAEQPAERQEYKRGLERLWSEETLQGLCRIIDTTDDVSAETMQTLSRMIGATTPAVLYELLGLIEKSRMRKVVLNVATTIARDDPRSLIPHLKDRRWYLVRNMVFILGELRDSSLLDQVAALITHRDIRVRKEVLRYLLAVPDPRAKPYILKFLRDESGHMRVRAVQLMGRARLQIALKPLMEFAESDVFDLFEIAEKMAVYEAIADLGGEKVLPLFKGMLTKKFHFQRTREREAVICASFALQKIPGEASLKLLQDALKAKTKEHHEVIIAAIKALSGSSPVPS